MSDDAATMLRYEITQLRRARRFLPGNVEPVVDKAGKRQPRMEFRGEFLHAYLDTERVKSHKPVELIRGRDQFTADSMDFDNLERVMQLKGRVKGTLVPGAEK